MLKDKIKDYIDKYPVLKTEIEDLVILYLDEISEGNSQISEQNKLLNSIEKLINEL